jgi:competence protein ComEA
MRVVNFSVRLSPAILALFFLWATSVANLPVAQAQTKPAPVNVNTADLTTLETLPGVGPATAQKIIDGRPYKNASDLAKVPGLSNAKVDAMKDQITFKGSKSKSSSADTTNTTKKTSSSGKVNVNTADLTTLETLPGVGATTAQRIIDGRPYHSAADLEKVQGLSKSKVEAMQDQITFGKSHASKSTSDKSSSATAQSDKSGSQEMQPTGRSTSDTLAPGQKININKASAEQLDSLFGIGPVKSQAIVDYRNEHGKFKSIEDIMNVNGIKQGEFDKIKDHITVK